MTRAQAGTIEEWTPWKSNFGDDFTNWLQWMTNQKGCYVLNTIKTIEAIEMYRAIKQMAWECHINHPGLEADIGE